MLLPVREYTGGELGRLHDTVKKQKKWQKKEQKVHLQDPKCLKHSAFCCIVKAWSVLKSLPNLRPSSKWRQQQLCWFCWFGCALLPASRLILCPHGKCHRVKVSGSCGDVVLRLTSFLCAYRSIQNSRSLSSNTRDEGAHAGDVHDTHRGQTHRDWKSVLIMLQLIH